MPSKQVLIELSPSSLAVSLLRGGSAANRRASRHHIPTWTESWPAALASLDDILARAIASLDAAGADATVLYSSPDAAAAVFACPAAAGPSRAAAAARLALAESIPFDLDTNPHALATLALDPRAANPARRHTLTAADTDASASVLAAWLERTGLRATALIPADAALLASAVAAAIDRSRAASACAAVIGEHATILAGAEHGALRFVRQIGIGVETLIAALARDDAADPIAARESAAALLARIGIPRAGDDAPDSLLPRLQPALQRCIVEIRQSLRVGMPDAEGLRLVIAGPGAAVPRLAEILGAQTSLPVETVPGDPLPATLPRLRAINLLPREIATPRARARLTRGLWVGAASAATLLLADAALLRFDTAMQHRRAEALSARLLGTRQTLDAAGQLAAARAGLDRARRALADGLGPAVNADAVLAMLAHATPPPIRLTSIDLDRTPGRPTLRLRGYTPTAEPTDATARIKTYLDDLAAIPIVASCTLGATRRIREAGAASQEFEITLSFVELPPGALAAASEAPAALAGEAP